MKIITLRLAASAFLALFLSPFCANAQDSSIYIQCPTATRLHPDTDGDATTREAGIVCGSMSAGDGMVTMADDAQTPLYIFGFNRLDLPHDLGGSASTPDQNVIDSQYPNWVMENGMMAANAPGATITVNEDDEVFMSLTNVGMAMRPDLFDPHTIHWHGFPNAASVFDGVPDASISIAGGATLTYYYNPKDAGTYMYHCHVEATEHMQMGMLGNLYVHPRQDKLAVGDDVVAAFASNYANTANGGLTPPPNPLTVPTGGEELRGSEAGYAYNDGDRSTRYDIEVPVQIGSFDRTFHEQHLAVQPLPFAAMKDTYFLLNGRGYPDTVADHVISTEDPLGATHPSQPVHTLIQATPGQRILLRISNLNVTTFSTLGTSGIPMQVVALDARLLRDDDGNNMYYMTNSVTLGGGQSADVIITAPAAAGTYFLYSKNLYQLSNDAENFGGMMTEIRVN